MFWCPVIFGFTLFLLSYSLFISAAKDQEEVYPEKIDGTRYKRDLSTLNYLKGEHDGQVSYMIRTFDDNYILDLIKNKEAISSHVIVQTYSSGNGEPIIEKHEVNNCHYQGKVRGVPDSSVVISTCHGLRGLVETPSGTFYIEPTDSDGKGPHRIHLAKDDSVKCGNKHDSDDGVTNSSNTHGRHKRSVGHAVNVDEFYKPYLTTDETRFNEVVFVVDHNMYNHYKGDIEVIKGMVFTLVNAVDAIYVRINIRIQIVGLELWTQGDRMKREQYGGPELGSFKGYMKTKPFKDLDFDNAHLLSLTGWIDCAGMAFVNGMCGTTSVAVNSWSNTSIIGPYAILAHEMGHNFNFHHDTSNCKCLTARGCIMGGHKTRNPGFSDCNLNSLAKISNDKCLYNTPNKVLTKPVCGNGVLESGEQCDCGSTEACLKNDPCCDPYICQLKQHFQCSNMDECCTDCLYSRQGTVCRTMKTYCDLPEFCTGKSSTCPVDINKPNGHPCSRTRQLFIGNKDYWRVNKVKLPERIQASSVRIHPQYFNSRIAMRLEIYGCSSNDASPEEPTPLQSNGQYCIVPSKTGCNALAISGSNVLYEKGTLCDKEYMKFSLDSAGTLRQHCTGLKVCTKKHDNGAELVIDESCADDMSKWSITDTSTIKHTSSGKCIHPSSGWPKQGATATIRTGCAIDRIKLNFMRQDCIFPFGVEDGRIHDANITASSYLNGNTMAKHARLNSKTYWSPKRQGKSEWIRIDFGKVKTVSTIAVQGRATWKEWVTGFFVDYTDNGQHWTAITETGSDDEAAYCYNGKCPQTRTAQCRDIWGPTAGDGAKECYNKFNIEAKGFGTCEPGKNSSCTTEHVLCGQLQCDSPADKPIGNIGWTYGKEKIGDKQCSKIALKNEDNIGDAMIADGTKCGTDKVCNGNKCKPFVYKPMLKKVNTKPIDGGWGDWSTWSECSRPCGDGTQSRHRFCNKPIPQNGGSYCSGHRVEEVSCSLHVCPAVRSCRHLQEIGKSRGNIYPDGIYVIDPTGISPIKAYCDMTRDGGGWTLLVTSDTNTWTKDTVLEKNIDQPTLNGDYSILKLANSIKDNLNVSGPTFEYRLEAQKFGRWGGIWSAPRGFSFVSTTNRQVNVKLTKKFDDWEYSNSAIECRMPWVSGARLTTSEESDKSWYGSITGDDANYHPAPWIRGPLQEEAPEFIWYWVREGGVETPRSCQEVQLRQLRLPNPIAQDGYYVIKPDGKTEVKTYCKLSQYGGGWTLVYSTNDWDISFSNVKPSDSPLDADEFTITGTTKDMIMADGLNKDFQFLLQIGDDETVRPVAAESLHLKRIIRSLNVPENKRARLWIREGGSRRSCNDIKIHAEHRGKKNLRDGLYMINTQTDTYVPLYCDMESSNGGWTLIVTSAHNSWTHKQVEMRNANTPSTTNDYSILYMADNIKSLSNAGTFQYRLEAGQMGHWGGVWTAPMTYSFVSRSKDQTAVNRTEKFDDWEYSWWKAIEKRMPYIVDSGNQALLTTSYYADYHWSGTIISGNSEYNPAPWMMYKLHNPGFIYYWLNEDDCASDRKKVDGGLTKWSEWLPCDCKRNSIERKTRSCTNPKNICGGAPCPESEALEMTKNCFCQETPIKSSNNLCLAPSSGICVPVDDTILTFHAPGENGDCSEKYMQFTYGPDNIIRHVCSGKTICTKGDVKPTWSTRLVLRENCIETNAAFERETNKALRNKNSDYCVHPNGGQHVKGVEAVYWKGCVKREALLFPKL